MEPASGTGEQNLLSRSTRRVLAMARLLLDRAELDLCGSLEFWSGWRRQRIVSMERQKRNIDTIERHSTMSTLSKSGALDLIGATGA